MATVASAELSRVDAAVFVSTAVVLPGGTRGAIVNVPTRNPVDYGPAIHGDLGAEVLLSAQLFSPSVSGGRVSAVVIVPGSAGIGLHHLDQASAFVRRALQCSFLIRFMHMGSATRLPIRGG